MGPDHDFCFHHSPDRADERLAARRRGGYNAAAVNHPATSIPTDIRSVRDALRFLEQAVADAMSSSPSLRRARVLVAIAVAAHRIIEASELEERLRVLEERIA